MSLEKGIIKATSADKASYEYKPRELNLNSSTIAKTFVSEDAFVSKDFKISDLVAQQAGITQLADDAQRDKINALVLEQLKDVQEKAYKEGYELGLVEGTEKAFQDSRGELIERLRNMESILKRIEELKSHLLVNHEAALIQLVFQVAKKIAVRDLEENRDAVLHILKEVVGEVQADERVVVRLAGEDLLFLESLQEKSGEKIESLRRIKFISDENVKPGGCLIDTEYGSVDATVEERVERTWQTLNSRVPHAPKPDKE